LPGARVDPSILDRPQRNKLYERLAGRLAREGLQSVARELGVSGRTLKRRLAAQGFTVRGLVDSWRLKAIQRALVEGVDLASLSMAIGFSSPSVLCRYIRSRLGVSSSELRRRPQDDESLEGLRRPSLRARGTDTKLA
jgi:AraC-like DNA-binding protein